MAHDIPPQGIKTYMDALVSERTPPNLSWRIKKWAATSWLVIGLGFATLILALVGPSLWPQWKDEIAGICGLILIAMIAFFVFLTIMNRDPGYWRRYSPYQFALRYEEAGKQMFDYVAALRKNDAKAEFEIAVLEQGGKWYGAVLFMVYDHHGRLPDSGVPLKVFDTEDPLQFGEAYSVS